MKPIFLVKETEIELARLMESKLLSLPLSSGIIFVGVSVSPANDTRTHPIYLVWVGCTHALDARVIDPLVRVALREEIAQGASIVVDARNGVVRSESC